MRHLAFKSRILLAVMIAMMATPSAMSWQVTRRPRVPLPGPAGGAGGPGRWKKISGTGWA